MTTAMFKKWKIVKNCAFLEKQITKAAMHVIYTNQSNNTTHIHHSVILSMVHGIA